MGLQGKNCQSARRRGSACRFQPGPRRADPVEEVGQFIVPPLNFADGEDAQNDLPEPFRPGGSGADLLKIDQLVADGDEGRQARTRGEQSLAPLPCFGEVGFEAAYVFVPSAFSRGVATRGR